MRTAETDVLAAQRHQNSGQHGEHGKAAPEEQPALEPPAVEQQIGLQTHRQ